jgi:hypothetical protein
MLDLKYDVKDKRFHLGYHDPEIGWFEFLRFDEESDGLCVAEGILDCFRPMVSHVEMKLTELQEHWQRLRLQWREVQLEVVDGLRTENQFAACEKTILETRAVFRRLLRVTDDDVLYVDQVKVV